MVNNTTSTQPQNSAGQGRILVIEPEPELASKIQAALHEAAPSATAELARNIEEAQRLVVSHRPDLFVLDVDAIPDLSRDFLFDLRTSHPNARAIVLTGAHMATHREQVAGLGAIHFLEKPFPHDDFVVLVQALLSPPGEADSERFQGTLSDLHLADIIQLKCMAGSSAALQFTGPQGEKARVYFESGQVRHAVAPGKEGIAAFNEIVNWKGGQISEVAGAPQTPRTIDLDWQILLMEAVRSMDETRGKPVIAKKAKTAPAGRKILVIDDSLMLLSFVKEILAEANYQVVPAATAEEGLVAAANDPPDLILLDYVLPDMKGDEVCRHLSQNPITESVRIVYMSGFGADLKHDKAGGSRNVIGLLNKPFTSDLLLRTVERYMPKESDDSGSAVAETPSSPSAQPATESSWAPPPEPMAPEPPQPEPARPGPEPSTFASTFAPVWPEPALEPVVSEKAAEPEPMTTTPATSNDVEDVGIAAGAGAAADSWWSAPITPPAIEQPTWSEPIPEPTMAHMFEPAAVPTRPHEQSPLSASGVYFAGNTGFFSLNAALQTIEKEKLTGTLRLSWNHDPVELFARNGEVVLVTTHDPQLYCPEAPVTLVNVDAEKTEEARAKQRETGCPIFLTLAQQKLVVRDAAIQLVQHYGQKLFVQLWITPNVRFEFEQGESLPEYCHDVPREADMDYWMLSTLRSIQLSDLEATGDFDAGNIPAYTRKGYDRVQGLRLTVAEAQFASQFNGARSVAQIARNLRLDLKYARLTLFRFLALEIVDCWPPSPVAKAEKRGFLQGIGKSIGFGE